MAAVDSDKPRRRFTRVVVLGRPLVVPVGDHAGRVVAFETIEYDDAEPDPGHVLSDGSEARVYQVARLICARPDAAGPSEYRPAAPLDLAVATRYIAATYLAFKS